MHHPNLEKQLEELKAQRQEATATLRDLACEAVESNEKVNKTMMMYLTPSGQNGCECITTYCSCTKAKKKTSRIFKNGKRKLKRKLRDTNETSP